MKKSKEFAEQFVEKLDKKEMCPKPEFIMTDDDVEEELEKYNRVLDSGILDVVTMGETIGYLKTEKENSRRQEMKKIGETIQILKQRKETTEDNRKDCSTYQNEFCTEDHSKLVPECYDYINYDQCKNSTVRRILAKRKNNK